MGEVHQNFVQAVMEGRKGKLHGDPATLFNGDFWSGQSALKLGLVDNLGNLMDAMDNEFKTNTFKEYGSEPGFIRMISSQLSSSFDSMFYTYT
jgi:protease-4